MADPQNKDPYAAYGGQVAADPYAAYGGGKDEAPTAPVDPNADKGVLASLKRAGGGLIHLPGALYDAATKDPQNPDEQYTDKVMGRGALALKRLVTDPMYAQHVKAQDLRAQAATQSPEQANNAYSGTQHMANMHDMASVVPVLGPMSADIVARYLGESGQPQDKSGAVTDFATAVVGPKVAEGVSSGVGSIVKKIAPGMAERMYQSALKPSTTLSTAERADIVRTGLDQKIPISQEGAQKISDLVQELNNKVKGQIKAGAAAGQTVDPDLIAARTGPLKARFANQVNPTSDLAAIDSGTQEFKANNPNPIPVDQAQAMKQGTYQQLKGRAYGELGSAAKETQKALARGIKEELEKQFPEIKGLNAQESKLYDLDGTLEKALNRIGNHQLMGIGTPIVTGAASGLGGALLGHGPEAASLGLGVGVMKAVLDNPAVKSRLAIALNKAGRGSVPYAAANARVAQFVNALAQSQNGAGAQEYDTEK